MRSRNVCMKHPLFCFYRNYAYFYFFGIKNLPVVNRRLYSNINARDANVDNIEIENVSSVMRYLD